MQTIIRLQGAALAALREALASDTTYSVRIAIDGGVKIKVNEGMWTLPLAGATSGEDAR